jgi:hypothetical protein
MVARVGKAEDTGKGKNLGIRPPAGASPLAAGEVPAMSSFVRFGKLRLFDKNYHLNTGRNS